MPGMYRHLCRMTRMRRWVLLGALGKRRRRASKLQSPLSLSFAVFNIPTARPKHLTVLMSKLQSLNQFLGQLLDRRQQRGTFARYAASTTQQGMGGGYAPGLFGQNEDPLAGGAVHAAKRQRLAAACMLEDERIRRIRILVDKAAQALALLQLLAAHNLGRIATVLPETYKKQLADLTLRDLVCDARGEALATQLISGLVTQQLDGSGPVGTSGPGSTMPGVDVVASMLQRHCPAFFREDDRLYYQASAQLKAAEAAAPGSSERDGLIRSALSVLMRVPLAANLEYLTSQLAYLRAYKGMVDIPLAAAAALDPSNAALRPELGPECEAARTRRREAYRHVLEALQLLATGSGNPAQAAATAAGAPPEQAGALPASERSTAKNAILNAALSSSDRYFHTCLYDTLIDLGDVGTLLSNLTPHLQSYLTENSGLGSGLTQAAAGGDVVPVGPITQRQYRLAELLARHMVTQSRFKEAAAVYKCLAVRKSGPGQQEVPLTQRVACLQSAVLQARSVGSSELVSALEADAKLMELQAACADRIQGMRSHGGQSSADDLSRLESEITSRPLDVTTLYNDFCQPLRMWDLCLQLVHFAGTAVDSGLVRQLWDHSMLAAYEGSITMGLDASGLQGVTSLVEKLGSQFYPSSVSFPLTHVVYRLVQLATGRWPANTSGGTSTEDSSRRASNSGREAYVARAVLAACGGSISTALRCFELLLSRRAPDVPESELASLPVRLALLRCLSEVCITAQNELGSALVAPGLAGQLAGPSTPAAGLATLPGVLAQREAGALAEACERFALEAKRLGTPDANALADSFSAVRRALQARLGTLA